ncbi:MAG: hypothetical protein C5B50_16040 [Verrucomicrobia bacterium]|nr:MAG: hypothetical protein C5B50_16040 [Verrucomicrobiota bacterium]
MDYDDGDYVTANSHVQSGLKWANVIWAFRTGHASNWHPLTWLSHMLDVSLFGPGPGPQHVVNVVLHVANTVLLFLVLWKITRAQWRSAMVAALFALHPIHVESVAWISERKDVLSGFFFMLTLWAYAGYVERVEGRGSRVGAEVQSPSAFAKAMADKKSKVQSPKSKVQSSERDAPGSPFEVQSSRFKVQGSYSSLDPRPPTLDSRSGQWSVVSGPLWYLATLLFFALGLMSKPMLVTLPFVLLLIDFWPLKRVSGIMCQVPPEAGPGATRNTQHATRNTWLVLDKVPFLLLSILSCVVTFLVQRQGGAVSNALTPGERSANAVVSYVRYLWKILYPADLSVLYLHPGHWSGWKILGATGLLALISAVVIAVARRLPYLAMGWFWFIGMFVPVIGLVQVGLQSMADRYSYLPSIGLFILIIWAIADTWPLLASDRPDRSDQIWIWPALGGAGVISCCALMTLAQLRYWQNTQTLFERATHVDTKNYLAYNNLGFYFENNKQPDRALTNYEQSLKINPNYEEALNNYGHILAGRKQYAEAIAYYQKALSIKPDQVEIHNNLGNALSETGKIDEAIEHYRFALSRKPDHADAHNNLGIALAMKGKLDEAMEHFHSAIQLKPSDASAHSNLGNAFAAQHKFPEATKEFQESLRLKPNEPQAHNNLGNVLAEQGRIDEAITEYNAAIRLQPADPEAHYNLALALLRQGKRPDAKSHLVEALRLRPDYPNARAQLNVIEAGR